MADFRKIDPKEILDNPFGLIGDQWALAAAKKEDITNAMTISWGGVGILWNQPVAFLFVRPQRHTYSFVEGAEGFSLTFFEEAYRKELQYFGTVSGRDEDKIAKTGFTVLEENGVPYFKESRMALICKKLYAQDLREDCALDPIVMAQYPQKDFHRMYVAQIQSVLIKE